VFESAADEVAEL